MKVRVDPRDIPAYLELIMRECRLCQSEIGHTHSPTGRRCFYPNCNRRILEERILDRS